MWTLSEQALEEPKNAFFKHLMVWYYDKWLPIVAGKEWWGRDIRYYKRPIDNVDVNGVSKVAVTVTSEAFGLLVLENCWSKWRAIIAWHEKHPGVPVPTSKPQNEPFQAKWSLSRNGQVQFGGWHPDAFEAFDKYITEVEFMRDTDKASNYGCMDLARKYMRAARDIKEDSPGKKSRSRKAVG